MREVLVRRADIFEYVVIEKSIFYLKKADELGIGGKQVHYADPSRFARTLSAIRNVAVKPVVFGSPKLIASFIRFGIDFDIVTTRDLEKKILIYDRLDEAIEAHPGKYVVSFADSLVGYTKLRNVPNVKFYSYVPPVVNNILFLTLDSKLTEKTLLSYIISPTDTIIVYEKLSSSVNKSSDFEESNLNSLFD